MWSDIIQTGKTAIHSRAFIDHIQIEKEIDKCLKGPS